MKISLENQYVETLERYKRRSNPVGVVGLVLAGLLLGLCVRRCDPQPTVKRTDCTCCHNKLTAYFQKSGSKSPEEMAYAVIHTRSPKLLAAVAVVESRGNHTVKNTGYRKRHDGAFQVNRRYWGTVPSDAVGQALQAERILEELTAEYPIKKALSKYGGDSTNRYQRKVLAELLLVP